MRKLLVMLVVIGIAVSSGLVQAQPTQSEDCVQTQVQSSCLPNLSMETASPDPMEEPKLHLECEVEANAQSGQSCSCEVLNLFYVALRQELEEMYSVLDKNWYVSEQYSTVTTNWWRMINAYIMAIGRRLGGDVVLYRKGRSLLSKVSSEFVKAEIPTWGAMGWLGTLNDRLMMLEIELNRVSVHLKLCLDKDYIVEKLTTIFYEMQEVIDDHNNEACSRLLRAQEHMELGFTAYLELRRMLGER